MRQINPGGSQCLLRRERQQAITADFRGYNQHSLKNLSQIQEDQRYPVYLTAPYHQSQLACGAFHISEGGHDREVVILPVLPSGQRGKVVLSAAKKE